MSYRNFLVLSDRLLILILVHRSLEDTDLVMSDVIQDLRGVSVNA